jgi:23S rRNA (uridine2552-2'-O)-methyltransferase
MAFVRKDHFHRKAKTEGYRSRAAYKLQELQTRFSIFRRGDRVIDLGAAPGGWLQVAAEFVKREGRIVGIDLLPIEPLPFPQLQILQGDILDPSTPQSLLSILGSRANVILSDMAPNISGVRITDCARSFDLAMMALQFARNAIEVGGNFIVKIFPGDDFDLFLSECKRSFRKVRTTKPEATRKTSSELYVICLNFREITET